MGTGISGLRYMGMSVDELITKWEQVIASDFSASDEETKQEVTVSRETPKRSHHRQRLSVAELCERLGRYLERKRLLDEAIRDLEAYAKMTR